MIKKTLLIFFFGAVIFTPTVSAQTITIPMPTVSVTPSPNPSPINYDLPYPGILPGSPLYGLKILKDKASEVFISSPSEKSNFYLHQSDKRLAASIALYEKGDSVSSIETLLKSVNYLEKSYTKMEEAEKSQENIYDIYGKMKASLIKHQEKIEDFKISAKEEDLEKLEIYHQRVQELQNKVNSLNP